MNPAESFRSKLACLVAVLILSSGCTSLPNAPQIADLAQLNWQGRFSAITDPVAADGQTPTRDRESVSGQFNLSQSGLSPSDLRSSNPSETLGKELVLELANPLGLAVARLRVRSGQAVLQIANQADRQASDLDTLTEQAMGWRVPVDKMANWLSGKSNGPSDKALFDANGRLTEATDSGWRLTVSAWRDDGKPQRLHIQWPTTDSFTPKVPHSKVSLRLIVDSATGALP